MPPLIIGAAEAANAESETAGAVTLLSRTSVAAQALTANRIEGNCHVCHAVTHTSIINRTKNQKLHQKGVDHNYIIILLLYFL